MRSRLVVALLVAGVTVGAVACNDERSPASGGHLDVLAGTDATSVTGTEVPVVVPGGSFTFTVSAPTGDLPDDVDVDGSGDSADPSYIGIAWRPDGVAPELGPVLHGTVPQTAPVRVTQSGESVALTELGADVTGGNANGVVWLAVEDGGAVLTLEVEYDGLVQTFDLATGRRTPGPADGFYDDTGTARVDCPDGETTDGPWSYTLACTVSDVAAVPYVAGLGWAEEGRTWLVLGVDLTPSRFTWSGDGAEADYEVTGQSGTVGADGTDGTVLSEDDPPGDGWSAAVALQVDADAPVTLTVDRTYELARASGSDATPAAGDVTWTSSIDLPPSSRRS